MPISDFAQSMIPAMLFVVAMLVIFGGQPNNGLLALWSNGAYDTPGQIGNTDLNTNLEGTPFATQTSTGLIEDNNPFFNLISKLDIIPKVAHTFEILANVFADTFSFLPPQLVWVIGLPLLVVMTIGLVFFLLNASGISKGGGA